MNIVLAYFVAVLIIGLLHAFAAFSLLRYRYVGDKSLLFISIFTVIFVADVIFTVAILARVPSAAPSATTFPFS